MELTLKFEDIEQMIAILDYYKEITEGKFVRVDGNDSGLAITKELMGDALTDDEREMFEGALF